MSTPLHVAVALDGAGWHPAAWREPDADSGALFTSRYWRDVVRTAENGDVDLVTFEDSLGLQTAGFGGLDLRADQVRGRLDAVLIANAVAPATTRIGLVPTTSTTHTEPFHVSTAIATLDIVSGGRGGWRPQVSGRSWESDHFGRRVIPGFVPDASGGLGPDAEATIRELFDEAGDFAEVVRRLWDSWEDDAVIRDTPTGRYLDRERLHYIDFEGAAFSVKGPSITPRSPQGQPLVTVLAHQTIPYRFAAAQGDVVYVTPHTDEQVVLIVDEVRSAEAFVGRSGEPLRVWADLVVVVDDTRAEAEARLRRLDETSGEALRSDALVVADSANGLVERILHWQALGVQGVRLRPAAVPHDLTAIAEQVTPRLKAAGVLGRPSDARSLREALGLPAAANRYATTEVNA